MAYSTEQKIILVHAGINPEIPLERQWLATLCNIRRINKTVWVKYLEDKLWPYKIIFGHYSSLCLSDPVISTSFICLDTGCYNTGVLSYIKCNPLQSVIEGKINVYTSNERITLKEIL